MYFVQWRGQTSFDNSITSTVWYFLSEPAVLCYPVTVRVDVATGKGSVMITLDDTLSTMQVAAQWVDDVMLQASARWGSAVIPAILLIPLLCVYTMSTLKGIVAQYDSDIFAICGRPFSQHKL